MDILLTVDLRLWTFDLQCDVIDCSLKEQIVKRRSLVTAIEMLYLYKEITCIT